MIRAWILAALCTGAVPALAADAGHDAAPRIALEACSLPGAEGEVRCGSYEVYEDRQARSGRKIRLFVAVLPALSRPAEADPLFLIAGGPGTATTGLAGFAGRAFARVRQHRDVVLVDFAGTGRSEPLSCTLYPTARHLVGDLFPPDRIRGCRQALARDRNLRRYVTPVLVDDLDEVRAALGYGKINLYGTSYGSRASLEYLRRHGGNVRTAVMKAIAPPTMRGTMHYARDTERSLERLFDACAAEKACAAAYPELHREFRELLGRADRGELKGFVPDPQGGPAVELPLSRGAVVSALLGLLQSSNAAVRLPLLVHRAAGGDTAPLVAAIVEYRRGIDASFSVGMYLSVMCSEDEPRMDPADAALADRGTALGDYRVTQLVAACREWVRGEVPADYATTVRSDVPALLVSGTLDPNTNERWGEEAMSGLPNGTHVVIPNLSHGFTSIEECGAEFIARFIDAASMEGVDVSCKDRVALPQFAMPAD